MPIRDRSLYPKDWAAISKRVRARSGGRCECRGECGRDHTLEHRGGSNADRCSAWNKAMHPMTGSRVVLTVAHLDHDPRGRDEKRLKAMCQRCHLLYDIDEHVAQGHETRRRKARDRGQLEIKAVLP